MQRFCSTEFYLDTKRKIATSFSDRRISVACSIYRSNLPWRVSVTLRYTWYSLALIEYTDFYVCMKLRINETQIGKQRVAVQFHALTFLDRLTFLESKSEPRIGLSDLEQVQSVFSKSWKINHSSSQPLLLLRNEPTARARVYQPVTGNNFINFHFSRANIERHTEGHTYDVKSYRYRDRGACQRYTMKKTRVNHVCIGIACQLVQNRYRSQR